MAKNREATKFAIVYFDAFWRPQVVKCKDMDEVRTTYIKLTSPGDHHINPEHIHLYTLHGNVKEICDAADKNYTKMAFAEEWR